MAARLLKVAFHEPEGQAVAIVAFAASVAAFLLYLVDASPEVSGGFVLGIFGLQPAIKSVLARRAETPLQQIQTTIEGGYYSNPWLVALLVAAYLDLTARLSGAVIGAAIGVTVFAVLDHGRIYSPMDAFNIARLISPLFSLAICAIMIVPIAKWATHSTRSYAALPILGGIVLALLIQTLVITALDKTLEFPNVMMLSMRNSAFLLPGALIGGIWARRTHELWIINRSVRCLSEADRRTLLELLAALPGSSRGVGGVS